MARLLGKSHQSRCVDHPHQSNPALQVPRQWDESRRCVHFISLLKQYFFLKFILDLDALLSGKMQVTEQYA